MRIESSERLSSRQPRAYVLSSQRERLREAMVRVVGERRATTRRRSPRWPKWPASPSATFYEPFEDKEACFLESYDVVNEVFVAHVSDAYEAAAGPPWPERVAAALRALVELLAAEADIARMTMVEVTAAGEEARERYGQALERFTGLLEEGRDYSGQARTCRPTRRASPSAARPR